MPSAYCNMILEDKVGLCRGHSVLSAVSLQKWPATEIFFSDSADGGILFKASNRRLMFAVCWPVKSKTSNSFARCFPLSSFIGVTLFVSRTLMAASRFCARDCLNGESDSSSSGSDWNELPSSATLKRHDNILFACCIKDDFAGSAGRFFSAWLLYLLPPCKYLMRPTNLFLCSWMHRSKDFLSNYAKGVFCVASSPKNEFNTPPTARIVISWFNNFGQHDFTLHMCMIWHSPNLKVLSLDCDEILWCIHWQQC